MRAIACLIRNERRCFSGLPKKARQLVASFFIYSLAVPFLSLFVNAFIWRSTHDVATLAIYNLASFIALPFTFFFNGILQKRIKIVYLHLLGLMVKGSSALLIVFLNNHLGGDYFVLGLIHGIGGGFYWANRNQLSLVDTKDKDRNYFYGLISSLSSLAGLVVPLATGWFIVAGEHYGLYAAESAYRWIAVINLVLMWISGMILIKDGFRAKRIKSIVMKKVGEKWKGVRLMAFAMGLVGGLNFFLPSALVLNFLGQEEILGSFGSLKTVLVIVATYLLGRKLGVEKRLSMFFICSAFYLLGSLALYLPGVSGVITFLMVTGVSSGLIFAFSQTLISGIADKYISQNGQEPYEFIFDQEIFLNAGRILGVLLFLFALKIFEGYEAARLTMVWTAAFFVAISWLGAFVAYSKKLEIFDRGEFTE